MWECERWRICKTTTNVKLQVPKNFFYRRSLTEQQLLGGIKKGNQLGYVQCDIEVPKNLTANFPPKWKNTSVSKNDIGDLRKTYAKEEGKMSQRRKILIKSFKLQNGTLTTPLLFFYLQLRLFVMKTNRFLECTPKKCFNSFVQSAVDAKKKSDESPNSNVVAEKMKLLANNSYDYQIMDRNQHFQRSTSMTRKHLQLLMVNC